MATVETISLAAIRHRNGTVTLFDHEGRRITTLPAEAVGSIADHRVILWGEWARTEATDKATVSYSVRVSQDPWRKRINGMREAWKARLNSLRIGRNCGRTYWKPSHTWKQSLSVMMRLMSKRRDEQRKRDANKFRLWAATVSRNQNRRALEYANGTTD